MTVAGVGVYVLDLEGRPLFFEHEFKSYERGLSGMLVRKSWDRGRRVVEIIKGPGRESLLRSVYGVLEGALRGASGEAKDSLELAVRRGLGWLKEDEGRFRELYLPVTILPPDHYLSIVLQAVVGCIYNKCSFCNFYKDRLYRPKDPSEFREHALKVRRWLGLGIMVRRNVFLSDANPLSAPKGYVMEYVRIANDIFPEAGGIYSFADYFSTRLEPHDYSKLASLGLRRVYMGLESGSKDVLRLLNKPPNPDEAVRMALRLRDSGIARGIIVLVGAGGRGLWRRHVEETVSAIAKMDPGNDDIIFLSRLVLSPDLPYMKLVRDHLSEREMDLQEEQFRGAISGLGVKVASYNILESIY